MGFDILRPDFALFLPGSSGRKVFVSWFHFDVPPYGVSLFAREKFCCRFKNLLIQFGNLLVVGMFFFFAKSYATELRYILVD